MSRERWLTARYPGGLGGATACHQLQVKGRTAYVWEHADGSVKSECLREVRTWTDVAAAKGACRAALESRASAAEPVHRPVEVPVGPA